MAHLDRPSGAGDAGEVHQPGLSGPVADVVGQFAGVDVAPGEQPMSSSRPPEHTDRDTRPPVFARAASSRPAGDP